MCNHFLRMVKMRYRWVGNPEIVETKLCKLLVRIRHNMAYIPRDYIIDLYS